MIYIILFLAIFTSILEFRLLNKNCDNKIDQIIATILIISISILWTFIIFLINLI